MRQIEILHPKPSIGVGFIDELCERPDFQEAVDGLRNKWKIDVANEIHLSYEDYKLTDQSRLLKNKKFKNEVRRFQKKFDLGEEWSSFTEDYIFTDVIVYTNEGSDLLIEKRTGKDGDQVTNKPAYYLRIFPDTTKEDINNIWSEINEFIQAKKIKTKRNKPSKNLKRDRKIYKLAKLGFCIEDISNYIKKYYDVSMEYNAIVTAEIRYRKRMGIKEGNRLGLRKNGADLTAIQKLGADFPDD